jgi:hypothetical protein
MNAQRDDLAAFLSFSAVAIGYPVDVLAKTGQQTVYYDLVRAAVGDQLLSELLDAFTKSGLKDTLASPKLGAIGRNVMKLWYVACWDPLPDAWFAQYGKGINEGPFVASAEAFTEGLLWDAIGSHPPAAKIPGFGTWSSAPKT